MALKQILETKWSGVRRSALLGIGAGATYGVIARLLADPDQFHFVALLSTAFLGLVPIAVGYLAVFPASEPRFWYRIVIPWVPTVLSVATAAVVGWEKERRIAFTIDAQTDSIPRATLDPHVTIGGEYFDILTGEYRLVPLDNGRTRLVLISRHRVSTTMNAYTGWWARTIMKSIQQNILEIVRARAERDAAVQAGSRHRRHMDSATVAARRTETPV